MTTTHVFLFVNVMDLFAYTSKHGSMLSVHFCTHIFASLAVWPLQTLVDSMYRTIIDYCSRHPPFDGFTFGSPTWRDYMWFKAGLCKKLDLARKEFLGYYQTQIIELVGKSHGSS